MKKVWNFYKYRIIITFTVVTALIILVIFRVSYYYVKSIYIIQAREQVEEITKINSTQIDKQYLEVLKTGYTTPLVSKYFDDFQKNNPGFEKRSILVFSPDYKVLINPSKLKNNDEAKLLFLNDAELTKLKPGEITSSYPFQDTRGKWFLWGFYKYDDNLLLAIKEDAALFEKINLFETIAILVGCVLVLLSIITAVVLAKSIVHPINLLVKYSMDNFLGQYENPLPANLKGEISILANALEKMKLGIIKGQKDKEELLAQIAHEIRNPLGGIELLIGLVKEDATNDNSKKYLVTVLDELNHLKGLITSFLNYSKPASVLPEWFFLPELAQVITNNFENKLKQKSIKVNYNFDFTSIFFDKHHLQQILINLVSNSIDAIENDGTISINSYISDNNWIVSVEDDGNGITTEKMKELFSPFFTTKKNGTGLGLAICKKLADANDAVLVINEVNKGFSISIVKRVCDE